MQMQSRAISKDPIDFPLIDIKVEKVDGYDVVSWVSTHDNLKDAVLACEFEYENQNNPDDNDEFTVLDDGVRFYVVGRLNQIMNLTGGY